MKFKKFIAFAVVSTMVLGSSVTAFAGNDNINGEGVVEYDDSKDIAYDQVQVPVLVDANYAFKLDPYRMLPENDYDGATAYADGANVFFTATNARARVTAKEAASGAEQIVLYKEKYASVDNTDGVWDDVVTKVQTSGTAPNITYTYTVAGNLYVWEPGDAYKVLETDTFSSGNNGKYTLITGSNITKWFEVDGNEDGGTVELRRDYKTLAGDTGVCDGKIYQRTFEEITDIDDDGLTYIEDTDADPITNYVTLTGTAGERTIDSTKAFTGLYKDNAGTLATASDVTFVDYTTIKKDTTDTVYVKNLSTKDKTLTAKVTLKNATGLNIVDTLTSGSFASDDKAASVYIAAYKDGTAQALKDVDGVVSTTITLDLAKVTDDGVTTYQTTGTNAAGGHAYARYSGPNPTYTANSFKIEAKANAKTDDVTKKAWITYGNSVAADARPTINIVYSVVDKAEDADSGESGGESTGTVYTMNYNSNKQMYIATLTGVTGTLSAITIDGTDRSLQIGSSITFASSKLNITKAKGDAWGLNSGTKTIIATIGGTQYTIKITN